VSNIAIKAEGLSKKYHIGSAQKGYKTIRGSLTQVAGAPFRAVRSALRSSDVSRDNGNEIWAIKDVSFEIKPGEVVGIIGRNGAGKSTLLKVLSRITEPTRGYADIHGRVGSLLEVGTGFHPELTGRENVFLNGAIIGMGRKEIQRKFDEIVDFAEVEKFIDTPVKHYSSGMYLRLAFAVAAHLEPEIILVDEVLAVGDAHFQKKCLGKMGEIAQVGRTVLFVSHNLAAIQSLATRVIVTDQGQIVFDGSGQEGIQKYLTSSQSAMDGQALLNRTDRVGGDRVRLEDVSFYDGLARQPAIALVSGQSVIAGLTINNQLTTTVSDVVCSIGFFTMTGQYLFGCRSDCLGVTYSVDPGRTTLECCIPKWPLSEGRYVYNLMLQRSGDTLDWIKEAGYIDVHNGDFYGSGRLPAANRQGVFIDHFWEQHSPGVGATVGAG